MWIFTMSFDSRTLKTMARLFLTANVTPLVQVRDIMSFAFFCRSQHVIEFAGNCSLWRGRNCNCVSCNCQQSCSRYLIFFRWPNLIYWLLRLEKCFWIYLTCTELWPSMLFSDSTFNSFQESLFRVPFLWKWRHLGKLRG